MKTRTSSYWVSSRIFRIIWARKAKSYENKSSMMVKQLKESSCQVCQRFAFGQLTLHLVVAVTHLLWTDIRKKCICSILVTNVRVYPGFFFPQALSRYTIPTQPIIQNTNLYDKIWLNSFGYHRANNAHKTILDWHSHAAQCIQPQQWKKGYLFPSHRVLYLIAQSILWKVTTDDFSHYICLGT